MIRLPATLSPVLLCLAASLPGAGWTAPPQHEKPAAEALCAGCHADQAEQFTFNVHARLKPFELRGQLPGCEACHGPGAKHAEAGGDPKLIQGFQEEKARESSRACLGCHADGKAAEWHGSEHAMGGLACSSCHRIHQSRRTVTPMARALTPAASTARLNAPPPPASLLKPEPELCYDCHRDKRARMNYSSHHPVREGRMRCTSCHSVHGGQERLLASSENQNALCTTCHPSKQGPFVFEHAAVEEGCTTCHEPHGTVAVSLLKQNEPFLCLQCHEAHFHIGRAGADTAVRLPTGGSANPNGASGWRQAFTTKCTQCHSQVHGTDLPSQSTTSRGKSLTR